MVATTEPAACLARRPVSKVTVREPRAPLSITAVAVKTPSSASKSVVSVVGADIVSSSCVAYGDVLFAAVCAGGVRGDRSSIEALGVWRFLLLRLAAPRGPLPRTGPRGTAGVAAGGLLRRVPDERGDRPGVPERSPRWC